MPSSQDTNTNTKAEPYFCTGSTTAVVASPRDAGRQAAAGSDATPELSATVNTKEMEFSTACENELALVRDSHKDCNGFRKGGNLTNGNLQDVSASHNSSIGTSSAQPSFNGHISTKGHASHCDGQFTVSEISFAPALDTTVNGFLNDSARASPIVVSRASCNSEAGSVGSGVRKVHNGGVSEPSLYVTCLENLPKHPRACTDRAQFSSADVEMTEQDHALGCSDSFSEVQSSEEIISKFKESNVFQLRNPLHAHENWDPKTIAQLSAEHQIKSINYSSLPLPSPPSCGDQHELQRPLSEVNLTDASDGKLQNSFSLIKELLSEGNTRAKNGSKNDSCMERCSEMNGISTKNEGVQQLVQVVSQLQEEVQALLQQKAQLQLQLHQSKLLCAELNAQLQQMQHWHQPGLVADIVGELHAAQKMRDEAMMARVRLANEERDAVLRSYTLKQCPASSDTSSSRRLSGATAGSSGTRAYNPRLGSDSCMETCRVSPQGAEVSSTSLPPTLPSEGSTLRKNYLRHILSECDNSSPQFDRVRASMTSTPLSNSAKRSASNGGHLPCRVLNDSYEVLLSERDIPSSVHVAKHSNGVYSNSLIALGLERLGLNNVDTSSSLNYEENLSYAEQKEVVDNLTLPAGFALRPVVGGAPSGSAAWAIVRDRRALCGCGGQQQLACSPRLLMSGAERTSSPHRCQQHTGIFIDAQVTHL